MIKNEILYFTFYKHGYFNFKYNLIIYHKYIHAIFGRIGRIATEEVVLHLLLTKCVPILLYGLEACSIRKTDLDSLDFVVNRFFMKLFHSNNIDTVKECQMFFCMFEMPSTLLKKRVEKFQKQYQNHQNTVCQSVNNFKL